MYPNVVQLHTTTHSSAHLSFSSLQANPALQHELLKSGATWKQLLLELS